VPAVVSAVGGMLDTVVPGVTGYYVQSRDPVALSSTVKRLLNAPACRHRMGLAGAQRARRLYDWNRIADLHLSLYLKLIRASKMPAH